LRKCVARGFGFLFSDKTYNSEDEKYIALTQIGRDPHQKGLSETDKTIVARLFKEKRINLLMATDAVGIGVNIGVKTIIFPSLVKRTGDTSGPINTRDLAQIVHRAGRAASTNATIYVPSAEIDVIRSAIMSSPEDFEPLGMTSPTFWKNAEVNICLMHKYFYFIYNRLSGM
jgi:replicative superfamily II helicase